MKFLRCILFVAFLFPIVFYSCSPNPKGDLYIMHVGGGPKFDNVKFKFGSRYVKTYGPGARNDSVFFREYDVIGDSLFILKEDNTMALKGEFKGGYISTTGASMVKMDLFYKIGLRKKRRYNPGGF